MSRPLCDDLGVAVEDLDVLERHAEAVGDDLAERRLVALAVRARAGDHLDLAGRQHPDGRVLPAAGAVVQRAQHPRRREAAHLGEGRDADAELDPVTALTPLLLLGPQRVVPEHLLGLGRGRLVVAGVVGHARDRGERELLVLDPVHLADLERVLADLGGELVHEALDGVRRLGTPGAPVGVDPRLVRQHGRAVELVGVPLVDRVEHPRTEDRYAAADDADVRAEVGEQVDLEAGDLALLGGGQRELLPLVAAVVGRDQRLRAGLGVLARLADLAGHRPGDPLLGSGLQLAAEPASDVGGDHADLRLRYARRGGEQEPGDVRDLGRRPHGDLLAGRVDDDGPRLHEGGDQPLLAVLALDDDAVGLRFGDDLVDGATGALARGVELPERGLVRAQVRVREDLVLGGLLEVQHGGQELVLDVHELGGVPGLGGAAGDDDGDDLAGERDPLGRHRQVGRGHLVRRDRPRVGDHALGLAEVLAREDLVDVQRPVGGLDVDAQDLGVRVRAADHRQVEHARERDVVGPAGAAGDEALVLLAAAVLADLRTDGRAVVDGGHAFAPSLCGAFAASFLSWAAYRTDFTMLW